MAIDLLPDAPDPATDTPQAFSEKGAAMVLAQKAMVPQINSTLITMNSLAVAAAASAQASDGSAQASAGSASAALASEARAADSVIAAASAANSPAWNSGTTYQQFASATSRLNFKSYKKITTAASNTGGAIDPASDPANWQPTVLPTTTRLARSSNTQLSFKDAGSLIEFTSGSFTQTFDAAAALGNGWAVWLRNSGSGDITLDPSGSETIDGRTSFVMYPGEVRFVQCDGTALRSIVIRGFSRTWTSSDTFVKPPGYTSFEGLLWAGGYSGDAAVSNSGSGSINANGGVGGACEPISISADAVSDTSAIIIGAGGTPVYAFTTSSPATYGNPGGSSQFADIVVSGIASKISGYSGAAGGTGSWSGSNGTDGGNATWGGAGGAGGVYSGTRKEGGVSYKGGNGGRGGLRSSSISPTAGQVPGGGGGGVVDGTSGAGARGELRLRGIA